VEYYSGIFNQNLIHILFNSTLFNRLFSRRIYISTPDNIYINNILFKKHMNHNSKRYVPALGKTLGMRAVISRVFCNRGRSFLWFAGNPVPGLRGVSR